MRDHDWNCRKRDRPAYIESTNSIGCPWSLIIEDNPLLDEVVPKFCEIHVCNHTRVYMTTTDDKQQPTTFVAIDIAKFRHEVMIEPPGRKRYRLTILNERAKHDRLIDHLRSCPAPVAVCFEPTGDYHRAIAWRLVDAGVDVSLISSVALARMREAIHNSWDKNDPKDAQVMLHMIKSGNVMRYVDPLAADEWAAGRTRPLRDGGLGRLDKLRCLSP